MRMIMMMTMRKIMDACTSNLVEFELNVQMNIFKKPRQNNKVKINYVLAIKISMNRTAVFELNNRVQMD